ncbi:hypothetical protein ACXZ65_17390 [Streptomyces aculeolatus]
MYVAPPLTTVRQDVLAWGCGAAEGLVAATEGRPFEEPELPAVEVVLRSSTPPPQWSSPLT